MVSGDGGVLAVGGLRHGANGWGSDFTAQESTSSLGPLLLPICTVEDKSRYMEKGETF